MAHAVTDLLGRKGVAQVWQAWQHHGHSTPSATRSRGPPIRLKIVLNECRYRYRYYPLDKWLKTPVIIPVARAQNSQNSVYVPVYDAIAR